MGNPDSNSVDVEVKEKDAEKTVFPRENLISHAVHFLMDKKVQGQDPSTLRRFLIKKGLTEEEASIAFQRFETLKNQSGATVYNQPPPSPFLLPTVPTPVPQSSFWLTVHRVVTTVTSIGGLIYAIYWLWKTYISPYLFGRRPKRKPVEQSLSELEAAVGSCATDLRTVRSSVDTMVADRAAGISLTSQLLGIKSEISSLKSLLLNRNQFPATPAPGPLSIPAWQIGSESHTEPGAEAEEEGSGSGSNGGTNGSDSSLEIVK